MSEILFHPNLKLTEADRIAREQGGRLMWKCGRVRLLKAKQFTDLAFDAFMNQDLTLSMEYLLKANKATEGVLCVSH